jgi:hypothetical protein
LAAIILVSACSDDPTGSNAVPGSVAFNYTGAGGGSYNADGPISSFASQQTIHTTNWATGWRENASTSVNVAANVPQSGNLGNYFQLVVGRQSVGSSDIVLSCSSTNPACTSVELVVGVTQDASSFQYYCELSSGTVTITSITNDHAQGTFAGSGTCITGGVTPTQSAFSVTSGSFDVPLVATPPNI